MTTSLAPQKPATPVDYPTFTQSDGSVILPPRRHWPPLQDDATMFEALAASERGGDKPQASVPAHTWTEGEAFARLDEIGIAAICDQVASGLSVQAMADAAGVTKSALWRWLHADLDRSTRARAARALTAWHWDEKAEAVLQQANDVLELARARELAHHFRWRASRIAPREYGDKADSTHEVGSHLATRLDAAQRRARIAELVAKIGAPGTDGSAEPGPARIAE